MNINQRVYEIMRNLLGSVSTGVNVDDDLILDEIPNIDSLFFLEMVSSFEKEFNIKFDLEDLVDKKTVGEYVVIIKQQIEDGL